MNVTENELKEFENKLGGRIIYSTLFRDCNTLKKDFIIYSIMNKYRARGIDNQFCAEFTKETLNESGVVLRFTPYYNTIMSRFYKIRKAIRDTKNEIKIN